MLEHLDCFRGTTLQMELELTNPHTDLPLDVTNLDLEVLVKHSHTDKDDVAIITKSSLFEGEKKVEKIDPVNGRIRVSIYPYETASLPAPYMLFILLRVTDRYKRVFVLKTYVLHVRSR